jgi:hypothetical protein
MTHHYAEQCLDDEEMMWCEACEDSVCECETLGSEDTWSDEEEATTSDEEFIAPEGSVHTEEKDDESEEEEEWDYDEDDTDDSDF